MERLAYTKTGAVREREGFVDLTSSIVGKRIFKPKGWVPTWKASLFFDHAMHYPVTTVDFSGDDVNDEGIRRVLTFDVHGRPFRDTLVKLELNGCQRISRRVLPLVADCTNLKSLSMSNVKALTDPMLVSISKNLKALTDLRISKSTNLSSKNIRDIAPLYWRNLRTLGLAHCSGVTDMALTAMARNKVH